MRELLRPIPIALLVIAAGLVAFGYAPFAIAAGIAWVGSLFLTFLKGSRVERVSDLRDRLDADARSRFVPIKRLEGQILQVLASRVNDSALNAISEGIREEVRAIVSESLRALDLRSRLHSAVRAKAIVVRSMQEAEQMPEGQERDLALAGRKIELDRFGQAEATIAEIDRGLELAKTALSEIHSRLLTSQLPELDPDALSMSAGRLGGLTASLDEAEQFLRS